MERSSPRLFQWYGVGTAKPTAAVASLNPLSTKDRPMRHSDSDPIVQKVTQQKVEIEPRKSTG